MKKLAAAALLAIAPLLISQPAQAETIQGHGLISQTGDTFIDGFDAASPGYTSRYYTESQGRHFIGSFTIERVHNGVTSGKFQDVSTDGSQGCYGRLIIRSNSTGRFDSTWYVDGTVHGLSCPTVSQSFTLANMQQGSFARNIPGESGRWAGIGRVESVGRRNPYPSATDSRDLRSPANAQTNYTRPEMMYLYIVQEIANSKNVNLGAISDYEMLRAGYGFCGMADDGHNQDSMMNFITQIAIEGGGTRAQMENASSGILIMSLAAPRTLCPEHENFWESQE